MNKSDISYYEKTMRDKIQMYDRCINRAEETYAENDGMPTKAEAEYYLKAAKLCSEIMSYNVSRPNIQAQWRTRLEYCEEQLKRIVPPKPVTPTETETPTDKVPTVKTSSVKTSPVKATAEGSKIPSETIDSWHQKKPDHSLKDISGMSKLKERLKGILDDIAWPELTAAVDKNALTTLYFYGPPGSGKTHIIEAFASDLMEKGYEFVALKGSDINQSAYGQSEKMVAAAFEEAAKKSTILFFDELDTLMGNRNDPQTLGVARRIVGAFLTGVDMLKKSGTHSVLIAATNHPKAIDEAMLSRGEMIYVPLPDNDSRKKFLETQLGTYKEEDAAICEDMANSTEEYGFRDLEAIVTKIGRQVKSNLKDEYRDKPNGDKIAAEAVKSGNVPLTREMCEKALAEVVPTNTTEIRKACEEYNARGAV